jgi:predicted ATPase/Tfp pilus assembly protein PilF
MVTLVGPAGIGKSRLAVQVAREYSRLFTHGACFVSLAPLDDPTFIAQTIADAMGVVLSPECDPVQQLAEFLHQKEILLVLDNFEHVLEGSEGVARLMQAAPGVVLIITSRQLLNLHAEWVFDVEGLPFPQAGNIEQNEYGAIELFKQRVRQVIRTFDPNEETITAIKRICQLVEGMPLAIELAAASTRRRPIGSIAQEIETGLEMLSHNWPDMPIRHRTMRAAFDHSWSLLNAGEKEAFRRISVFRGGFLPPAAGIITGLSQEMLESLVDKSLIRKREDGRFFMHTLLRYFSEEQLREAGETDSIHVKHLDYYLAMAEEAEPNLYGAEQQKWVGQLRQEQDNLRVGLDRSIQKGSLEIAARLGAALWRYWWMSGHIREGRDFLNRILERADPIPVDILAKAYNAAGGLAWVQGDLISAVSYYEESLTLRRRLRDKSGTAVVLTNLGAIAAHQGDYEQAQAWLEQALELHHELGNERGIAFTLSNLGDIAKEKNELQQAIVWYEKSAIYHRSQGDLLSLALCLNYLGDIYRYLSDFNQARNYYHEALAISREMGNKHVTADVMVNMGHVFSHQGSYLQAKEHYEVALTILRELEDCKTTALALVGMAVIDAASGQIQRSTQLLAASQAMLKTSGANLSNVDQSCFEQARQSAIVFLDDASFQRAWQEGSAMTLEQAVTYALADDPGILDAD